MKEVSERKKFKLISKPCIVWFEIGICMNIICISTGSKFKWITMIIGAWELEPKGSLLGWKT